MGWNEVSIYGKICLILNILIIFFYKQINKFLDPEDKHKNNFSMKDFLLLVPIILLFGQNLFYEINISPGWKIKEILDNEILNWILTTIGCYGIVLLTATDIGVDMGAKQHKLTQNMFLQFLILYGVAYDFTGKKNKALYGTILFYILKYSVSNNI